MEQVASEKKTKNNNPASATAPRAGDASSSSTSVRNVRRHSQRGEFNFGRGKFFPRKKECYFTKNHLHYIDYKDVNLLRSFLGKSGKILNPHFTGVKPKPQRRLAIAIKRARYMALLPFTGSIHFDSPRKEVAKEHPTKNSNTTGVAEESLPKPQANHPAAKNEGNPRDTILPL